MRGSEHNDLFTKNAKGDIQTRTNFSGGIQGGISNGMPIEFRVAFKPVATIMQSQPTIDSKGNEVVRLPSDTEPLAMLAFKITTVGASAGVILPKEALAHLKVKKGDTLYLTETPDGGYRLTPYNPEFERQMSLAEDIMHEDKEILRQLAK